MTHYARSGDVLWRRSGDTLVLLSPRGGDVVELSGTGAVLWDLLGEAISGEDVTRELARHFDAPADVVGHDIGPTLSELVRRGLVAETGGQ